MNQSNRMILGARESRDHQLSRAPKIIKIRRQVFAGEDFEQICLQIIDEIPLILIGSPGKKHTIKIYIKEKQNYTHDQCSIFLSTNSVSSL